MRSVKKSIAISVSNDGFTDQRILKQCDSFSAAGYNTHLFCRMLDVGSIEQNTVVTHRIRLPFRGGFFFYASLNIRLFFALLFSKTDIFYANDLDTLPANALVAAFRRKPLIYDSHEYFTEVPEVQNRPFVKSVWKNFERKCIGRASLVITVGDSIAKLLEEKYQLKEVMVVRNVPQANLNIKPYSKSEIGINPSKFLVLLQGAGINVDRGAEELVAAMQYLNDTVLLIIGTGDAIPQIKKETSRLKLDEKVIFIGKLPYEEMMRYTAAADLGVSIDKDTNINYRYSLPNKLFDYARAGIPVLVSDLVEIRKIIEKYRTGECIHSHQPKEIAKCIRHLLENDALLAKYKSNTERLNEELNWEKEFAPVLNKVKKIV